MTLSSVSQVFGSILLSYLSSSMKGSLYLQLCSFLYPLPACRCLKVQKALHFVLFLFLSVQMGSVSVYVILLKTLWISYKSHLGSVH